MSDTTLNLGSFQFALFEIPERIPFGGSQRLVKHELIGGTRVLDAMGRSDKPLAWSGLIQGTNATERARFLDTMRAQGQDQKLTFGQFAYLVKVAEFDAVYERFYQIPYSISCEVISDLANPVINISPPSIDSDIKTDMVLAQATAAAIADITLNQLLAQVQAQIELVTSFANSALSIIAGVRAPLASVAARVGVLLAASSGILGGVSSFGGVSPGANAGFAAASLVGQVANMGRMNSLLQLSSVVGRMSQNLGSISSSPNTITTAGGNLFSIAQQQYRDASAWTGIAKANNLTDPFVQGVQTLNIPSTPDLADGVLNA